MNIAFTFRNLESSDAIKDYASEKIGKLQKHFRAPLTAEVTASVERHLHCVDLTVTAGRKRYAGREESADMYASIDKAMDKIDKQVRRESSAQKAVRKKATVRE